MTQDIEQHLGGPILITGASGFIGSRLSRFLKESGHNVIDYTGTILNLQEMDGQFKDARIVIHLAAKVDERRTGRENEDYITVNVVGTRNVIAMCLKHHSKLIYFSSAAAKKRVNIYGLSKYFAEELVKFFCRTASLSAIIVRPVNLYDDGGVDRLGRKLDLSQGRHYPLSALFSDIERIIKNPASLHGCRTHQTGSFFKHEVLYRLKKIRNKFFY